MTDLQPLSPQLTAGETLLRTAVDCYLSAIFLFAECLEAVRPEIATPYRDQLIRLRRRLAFDTTVQTLTESRETLCNELASFTIKAREYRDVEAHDLTPMLALLERADSSFALSRDGYEDQFRHFSREMKALDSTESANPISGKLRNQLSSLEQFVAAVYEQNSKVFTRLHDHLEQTQTRLQVAETLAGIELDRQLQARIAAARPFCMVLLDIGQDRHGRRCEDEVLKQAAARIMEQIRTRDFACCRGANEFVILLESGLANAEIRARQIASWLGGPYRVGPLAVNVNVSIAAAEHIPGETPQQLFERVEQLLCSSKPDTPAQLAQLAEHLAAAPDQGETAEIPVHS